MAEQGRTQTRSAGLSTLLMSPMLMFKGVVEVRLANGNTKCAGRVEVKYNNEWGTVCGDFWDMNDAAVVCRQLNCGSAIEALQYGYYGPGSGPIWMDDVGCNGNETALSDCTHKEKHNCYHGEDAGVTCSGPIRLVGGDSDCSGHVEFHDGKQWKSVCDSHFGPKAADVVCWDLLCGKALLLPRETPLDEEVSPICDRDLHVMNSSVLISCLKESSTNPSCAHPNGTHVTCTRYTGFRLANRSTECAGRVEVQVMGTWGTLCASRWDLPDAHVLCRQLGCGFAEAIPKGGHFGSGSGPVWSDWFHCDGSEAHLAQCPVTVLGASLCSHEDDAAVICSGLAQPVSLRLVGGRSRCDGRVEILWHGTWGRVLDDQWDMEEARVVCRQLRCGEAEGAYIPPRAQRGTGPVGLRGVRCAGHEANLSLCNTSLPEATGIMEDVGAVCRGSWRVRLVDGGGRCAGRVEVYYQGQWGTVCDDAWDSADADVVCRQLSCGRAVEVAGSARFGEGSGQIWLDGVNCSGTEAALWDCRAQAWGRHDCGHKEDAGVVCSEFVALRLENSDGCSGRLQVFYNGTWGSVCSNSMTDDTAPLVCKQLGCGDSGTLETSSRYEKLSGIAWLDHIECGKSNRSFWQCPSAPWDPQSCDDLRDVTNIACSGRQPERPLVAACPNSTTCTDREKIRVVGGKDSCSGRVEVWHHGSWGTVCDDSWDMQDAEVVCRQLGCGPAVSALGEAAFGEGTGFIWLEQVECRGTELSLQDCWARPGDSGVCRHKEDAGVQCLASPRMTAFPPPADFPQGNPTDRVKASVPVVICIILGALLCLLLALLAGQRVKAQRRGSRRTEEPFPEVVYEEIGYSSAWEKQTMFDHSGECRPFEGTSARTFPLSLAPTAPPTTVFQLHHLHIPRLAPHGMLLLTVTRSLLLLDIAVVPRGDPEDGYDDAKEVPERENDPDSGQGHLEAPRTQEEGEEPRDAVRGVSLHSQRNSGGSGAGGDTLSLFLRSTGYDDVEEVTLAHPDGDMSTVKLERGTEGSLSPEQGEPISAMNLSAAAKEEKLVLLREL
ncbi:antigen WC1.1-like [Excalfactoria chinensis]|uniref:antigen WC1.1-like n=1 Tax=Excalfactoria chinensis TaxID=46218 RepID=UPI003B3A4F0D